jgi:hypothetical protein
VLRDLFISELLILVAAVLLVADLLALRLVIGLRGKLDSDGACLIRIVYRFGVIATVSQFLTLVSTILRQSDYDGSADVRLLIFFTAQCILATAFIRSVWEITHLPPDGHREGSTT